VSFPKYENYKDSGAKWLGEVPRHWALFQGRRVFAQTRNPPVAGDEQLSATQKYGVIPQTLFMQLEDQKVTLALSGIENFKHVDADDYVISLRSFQGGIERSKYDGCASPAYTVLKLRVPGDAGYWAFLLKAKPYIAALQSVTEGIRDGKTIGYEQFGQIVLPVPPYREQCGIAAFLDREIAKIDALEQIPVDFTHSLHA
jgi:type I restriction enzyme S subunit